MNVPSLEFTPAEGTYTLRFDALELRANFGARSGRRWRFAAGSRLEGPYPVTDAHGSGEGWRMSGSEGLLLEAHRYPGRPFVALRAGLQAAGPTPDALSPLHSLRLAMSTGPLDGWVNGYHSWSFSGLVPHSAAQPRMIPRIVTRPHAENTGVQPLTGAGRYTGEWVAALIERDQRALVAGFVGVERFFGQVYADGRRGHHRLWLENTLDGVPLPADGVLWGEWAIVYALDLPHPDPLADYAEAVTRLTPARGVHQPPAPAWSGWYQYFNRVSHAQMRENMQTLITHRDSLPFRVIQLDDGYQTAWGDWLSPNEKFPGGVKAWADEVRAAGYEAGLWISPYTVEPESQFAKEHPEALLRHPNGRPVHGGFLIERWLWGLDPIHPATQEHVTRVIRTAVQDWGISYLKLDFLYCGALPGQRHDPTRSRAQALREGLQLIREVAGDEVTILTCGCPLAPAIGVADIMRVSPDVAPYWYPELFGLILRGDFGMPAARNSILVSINRAWTQRRWWWLDADNVLLRVPAIREAVAGAASVLASHYVHSDNMELVAEDPELLARCADLVPDSEWTRIEVPGLFREVLPREVRQHRRDGSVRGLLINWDDVAVELRPGLKLPGHGADYRR